MAAILNFWSKLKFWIDKKILEENKLMIFLGYREEKKETKTNEQINVE